jgi:hypothetical protein
MSARNTKKKIIFLMIIGLSTVNSQALNNNPLSSSGTDLLEVDSIYNQARNNFDKFTSSLYLKNNDTTLNYEAFQQGIVGYMNMFKHNEISVERYLTIIDFSKPSNEERLFIFDVCKQKLVYKSIVSHGQKSGERYAEKFSNEKNSHQSSVGFYLTSKTYKSHKFDLALRLSGMEYTNSHAGSRGVVMHGADYASYEFLDKHGVLGRSYGCPAMPFDNFKQVVNWIKNGSCLYIYYPSNSYKKHSKYLNKKTYLEDFMPV